MVDDDVSDKGVDTNIDIEGEAEEDGGQDEEDVVNIDGYIDAETDRG